MKLQVTLPRSLAAPVAAGEEEGKAVLLLNGEEIAVCPITAGKTVKKGFFLVLLENF